MEENHEENFNNIISQMTNTEAESMLKKIFDENIVDKDRSTGHLSSEDRHEYPAYLVSNSEGLDGQFKERLSSSEPYPWDYRVGEDKNEFGFTVEDHLEWCMPCEQYVSWFFDHLDWILNSIEGRRWSRESQQITHDTLKNRFAEEAFNPFEKEIDLLEVGDSLEDRQEYLGPMMDDYITKESWKKLKEIDEENFKRFVRNAPPEMVGYIKKFQKDLESHMKQNINLKKMLDQEFGGSF